MDATADDYGPQLFNLFGQCVQGRGATKWKLVLKDYLNDAAHTPTAFLEAKKDYLEKIAEIRNLGDTLVMQLDSQRTKPAAMKFNDYLARRNEFKMYLDGDLLRTTRARATAQQDVDQIHLQQCNFHQEKYAAKHEDIEQDYDQLKAQFNDFHQEDVTSGAFINVIKSQREAKRIREARETGEVLERPHKSRRAREGGTAATIGSHPSAKEAEEEGHPIMGAATIARRVEATRTTDNATVATTAAVTDMEAEVAITPAGATVCRTIAATTATADVCASNATAMRAVATTEDVGATVATVATHTTSTRTYGALAPFKAGSTMRHIRKPSKMPLLE
ncbi:hypothetical protein ACHAWF_018090 [Thalassiosira exigua]